MNEAETRVGLAPTPHYQYAQRVGPQLFVAGQVPHDPEANLVGVESPSAQASQCLKNLFTLIKLHGFEARDIRQLRVYVVGEQQQLTEAWQAVSAWFDNNVPPATLLGVARLGYVDQLVEIDATIISEAVPSL